jgi:hypothetical protein
MVIVSRETVCDNERGDRDIGPEQWPRLAAEYAKGVAIPHREPTPLRYGAQAQQRGTE